MAVEQRAAIFPEGIAKGNDTRTETMSKTRSNHYVPQWYQEGFFEPGHNMFAYLDLTPAQSVLADGRVITARGLFNSPTSRAFCQKDLYSTFFGASVNDEIERRLFGDIDARGAKAIRAFAGDNVTEWHHHFQTLFEYIDIQKIRTPKGLDWLKAQYPTLTQNELMLEMQGIRMMHCTIWTEGVREIVSAEDANVKFIISDHPVTIFNHAAPPTAAACAYPYDPAIALKASQTIFPLNRDFCLILTNLEYARDPSASPLVKRTFARNYRNSMVRTDAFIRERKLSDQEVAQINYIIKARARRYIAAGRKEWLYPEQIVSEPWEELRKTLRPPDDSHWHFGGEMYARSEDGRVYYQDEFGRTEKQRDFLRKDLPVKPLRPGDLCGCGSGRPFKACCEQKPPAVRTSWTERSIRERNLMLQHGIVRILGLEKGKDWARVRRELSDAKISEIYFLYEALWPRETDLLQLLPKPDGTARAVYTGSIHPTTITEFALGASLYFGELIIEHSFLHAGSLKTEYSPVKNPGMYRHEFLKSLLFFFRVMPLVEAGLVNLIPDPCIFDMHLRDQMLNMAQSRTAGIKIDSSREARLQQLMRDDFNRNMMSLPRDVLRTRLKRASPEMDEVEFERVLQAIEKLKEHDPLAVLQEPSSAKGEKGGQYHLMTLAPNFEMAMYLAQATGSCIITDSLFRWEEIKRAIYQRSRSAISYLPTLAQNIEKSVFSFPQNTLDIGALAFEKDFANYPAVMRDAFKYLSERDGHKLKPNFEGHVSARFARAHLSAQAAIRKARIPVKEAHISCAFPLGGIRDNTVNRLLLMSSSERHLPSVPMAFFISAKE
jgi:uncharacterized protein YchJ